MYVRTVSQLKVVLSGDPLGRLTDSHEKIRLHFLTIMAEETALDHARRQRFVSILCRFPSFRVEEDEDEAVVQNFQQRGMTLSIHQSNFSDLGEKCFEEERGI